MTKEELHQWIRQYPFKSSPVVLLSLLQTIFYILTLIFCDSLKLKNLAPDTKTLISFGGRYPYKIRFEGQIWRFWTAELLSSSISKFTAALATNMTFGLAFEVIVKPKNMIIFVLCTFFAENLMGSLGDDISFGSRDTLLALIGGLLSFFLINWNELASINEYRSKFAIMLGIIAVLILLINFLFKGDPWGALGGIIAGFLLGFVLIKPILDGEKPRKMKLYGGLCLFLFLSIGLILFFTVANPQPLDL